MFAQKVLLLRVDNCFLPTITGKGTKCIDVFHTDACAVPWRGYAPDYAGSASFGSTAPPLRSERPKRARRTDAVMSQET